MSSHKEQMLSGEAYCADDPELLDDRRACRLLTERLNTTSVAEAAARQEILHTLLGGLGDKSEVLSPFQCDYGYQITIGARSFVNFGAVILDSAPVSIGDDVQIGPSVHLVTPTHPLDPTARRTRFESALPIRVGDGAWLATGVTSVVDLGGPFWNFDVRSEARTLAAAPDVFVTGPLMSPIAVPELAGAGDPPILKVSTEADVDELAAREIARKPDFLKFWYVNDPTTDKGTTERLLAHAAQVAHAHGLRLAVHVQALGQAKAALRSGADMLVHSIVNRPIEDSFVSLARAAHVTYTPTLVFEPLAADSGGDEAVRSGHSDRTSFSR